MRRTVLYGSPRGFFMTYYYTSELKHHGILGQKWGIRRFQNSDGTYTEAGKKRRRLSVKETFSNASNTISNTVSRNKDTINKIAKIAAITAVAGLSVYAISKNKEKTAELLKSVGSKSVKALSASAERVGNAMIDAALMSIGGVAISKLAEKLPTDDSVDEATRNKNKIIFDTASAGIKAATNAGNSNSNSKSNGGNVGKDITEKIGAPSNKGLDRQSNEYQNLFKDSNGNQRDSNTRAVIKSLASAGYDIDQLKAYIRGIDDGSIKHSLIDVGYFTVFSLLENIAL